MLSPEQILLRKTGVGGSDAAAVMGLCKYSTALDVYLDKTGEASKSTTDAMTRGSILEPFVKSLFEAKTGWRVDRVDGTQRSSDHPFMLANLDGFLPAERAIAEFKTVMYTSTTKEEWGEEGTDEIPNHYLIQVAHYASVMEADTVYMGVLFGDQKLFNAYIALQQSSLKTKEIISFDELGCDFRTYTYRKHSSLTRKIIEKEKFFWFDHVQRKVPPPPQQDCIEDFLKFYPRAINKTVEVSEIDREAVEQLRDIKQQIKDLEKQEQAAKLKVLNLFGEASTLVNSNNEPLASWKNKNTTRFDRSSFEKATLNYWKILWQ